MTQYVRLVIVPLFLLKVPAGHAGSGFETYGDIGQVVIPVAAALISWGEDDIEGLKQFGYSFATTTALVQGMKFTIATIRLWSEFSLRPYGGGIQRRQLSADPLWLALRVAGVHYGRCCGLVERECRAALLARYHRRSSHRDRD